MSWARSRTLVQNRPLKTTDCGGVTVFEIRGIREKIRETIREKIRF